MFVWCNVSLPDFFSDELASNVRAVMTSMIERPICIFLDCWLSGGELFYCPYDYTVVYLGKFGLGNSMAYSLLSQATMVVKSVSQYQLVASK